MKFINSLALVLICLLTPIICQAQYFTLPGDFSYSLNSINQVMDVGADGKLAVSLRNDPDLGLDLPGHQNLRKFRAAGSDGNSNKLYCLV